jgi:hypothetical protein
VKKRIARTVGWLALTAALALGAGCALYRNDRTYVPDEQYSYARDVFMQTGSLDLTERRLNDLAWERPKINEAMYRIRKEFEVLPEEVPAASAKTAATAGSESPGHK